MPPKKSQVNGFWLFAQSNKQRWKAEGLPVASNEQLLSLASPVWKSLSPEEKKEWDNRAKEERRSRKNEGVDDRLDNTGEVIALRRDPVEEARKRREREIAETTSHWHDKDVTEEKFYFVNFQDLCEVTEGEPVERRKWLPREMAILEYSLKDGICECYHQFIWPDQIPLGFRFCAQKNSDEYHRIPVEKLEEDTEDYRSVVDKAKEIISGGLREGRYPPLYCLTKEYEKTKCLCDWLWYRSGAATGQVNPLGKVHSLEDMVSQLLVFSGNPSTQNVPTFQITSLLEGSQWDYISSSSCDLHKELDVSRHCALAVVKRFAFTLSDMGSVHYNIELTERHVPVRTEEPKPSYRIVTHSEMAPVPARVGRGRGLKKTSGKRPGQAGDVGGGDGGGEGGGSGSRMTYAELSRPLMGRDEEEEREEEALPGSKPRSAWGQQMKLSPSPDRMGRDGALRAPDHPPSRGHEIGQFTDFQDIVEPVKVARELEEDDFPALQMSNMKVSNTSPVWRGGRGRGVGFAPAALEPDVWPSPGFGSAVKPTRGRGFIPGGPSVSPTVPPSVPASVPIGRGSTPPLPSSANQAVAMGRGIPVGRGAVPPGVAPRPTFGRGRMPVCERGSSPGYGEVQPSDFGMSSTFGRGYTPSHNGAPRPSFGEREMSPVQHDVMSYSPQAMLSFSGLRAGKAAGLDFDSDSFEPPLLETDFPSLQTVQRGGVHSARGVNFGAARGVTRGRGFMPPRGRGHMPPKGGNVHMS